MDWQRILLGGGILVAALMLLNEWGDFQTVQREANQTVVLATGPTLPSSNVSDMPTLTNESVVVSQLNSDIPQLEQSPVIRQPVITNRQLVNVHTDTLNVVIDTLGGDIVQVSLHNYLEKLPEEGEEEKPFILLNRIDDPAMSFTYIAQSGLVGKNGTDKADGSRPTFTSTQTEYQLSESADQLQVDLSLTTETATIIKRFTFKRDSNLINVDYIVDNQGTETWQANFYGQIKRDNSAIITTEGGMGMQPFLGAALTTKEDRYIKFTFDELAEEAVKEKVEGGWVSLVQHYFISAWIPDQKLSNNFSLRSRQQNDGSTVNLLGFTSPAITVPANTSGTLSASFYAGPKDTNKLEEISPYLDLTVDYGILWWVAKPLFAWLKWIHSFVQNWGVAIILLTVSIKLLFFPLSAASYKSMARMRKLTPKLTAMREACGDDKQKMSSEMMKLYKKEKVNPMGGCLPILVQMPVFIALYWVLMESVELRHTPFLYLLDLSVKDPYFILPLIMGATMFLQQRLNPAPPDPTQAMIMKWMPVMFTFFFLWFPAGLVAYWVVNNALSITQQWYITKKIEAQD